MAKIPLTIDPQYCSDWGWLEGVRELIQNAKDADEYESLQMEISHSARSNKLSITTKDVSLPASTLLLLGSTTKRGSEQRGQFGEGFNLGCLALVRAGHPVTIYNGDEVWRPAIEKAEDGPFAGQDLLVFSTRKLGHSRPNFTVEVENVTAEVWAATKKLFLFLSPPKPAEVVPAEGIGSVLLGKEYEQSVFARGIFVCRVPDLHCGYDLAHVKLDRDRRVVDAWELQWRLASVWNKAYPKDPEKFGPRIYEMAKANSADTRNLMHQADERLLRALRDEYEKEHGDAVPVKTTAESKELEQLGAKTTVVNATLQEILQKTGLSVAATKARLETAVKERHGWAELSEAERGACVHVERVTKDYVIATFNNPKTLCELTDDRKVGVARWLLGEQPRTIVQQAAVMEARRANKDISTIFLDILFPESVKATNGAVATPAEEVDAL